MSRIARAHREESHVRRCEVSWSLLISAPVLALSYILYVSLNTIIIAGRRTERVCFDHRCQIPTMFLRRFHGKLWRTAKGCQCTMNSSDFPWITLIKKKIKFSSYIRKFRREQLRSHIWLTAASFMGKYFRISSYIRKPFLIYDFGTAPLWISLYMKKILFYFLSVSYTSDALLMPILRATKKG